MSSPITFSGFNSIDFNSVLNLMMTQESVPRNTLAAQQTALKTKSSAFATLATKLSNLSTLAEDLTSTSTISGRSASTSDAATVSATATSSAVAGTYEVVVSQLASVQVTASSSQHDDSDTTVVASGGTLKIGSKTIDLTGKSLTLQGLADTINDTDDIGATATIVSPSTGKYQLVLTGKDTGAANAFSITNSMTLASGVSTVTFGGNARTALNAQITVNDVAITSASNTVTGAITGTTLELHKKTVTDESVAVTVSKDTSGAQTQVQNFVAAYNDLVTFIQKQGTDSNSLGRDPLLRSMWSSLRGAINARYTAGTSQSSLSAVGIGFDLTGKLTLDSSALSEALDASESDVLSLFKGSGTKEGAFASMTTLLDQYAGTGGLIATTKDRLTDQVASMDKQLSNMDARLALRRTALQQQFTAADTLMSQLNSSASSLTNLSSGYKLF